MNKILIAGILIGIMIGFFVGPQVATALYAIPPTRAWDQILFRYGNWTSTALDNINASSYTDNLYLVSDGSILFNVTTFP